MSDAPKKFKFEDLPPHVDMLCDALENRGASSSGIPHNSFVLKNAQRYRDILAKLRANEYSFDALLNDLSVLHHSMIHASENNQKHRIEKIVDALDVFMMKEYNKVYSKL